MKQINLPSRITRIERMLFGRWMSWRWRYVRRPIIRLLLATGLFHQHDPDLEGKCACGHQFPGTYI